MKRTKHTQLKILLPLLIYCLFSMQVFSQGIKIMGGASWKAQGGIAIKTTNGAGLAVDNSSSLAMGDQSELILQGDLNLNGASVELNGKIVFAGNTAQNLNADGQITLTDLSINNSAGLNLQAPVLLQGALDLIEGKITTTEQNLLTLTPRNSFGNGSSSSYINGWFAIRTKASSGESYDFTFPVGTASSYKPVILKFRQTNASSTTYRAQIVSGNIPEYILGNDIKNISPARHWQISNSNASNFSDAAITLPIATDDGMAAADAIIAKANDDVWENIGGKDITIPGTLTSTVSFSSLGDFIIAARQTAPGFSLSSESLTESEDFEDIRTVTISPEANTPTANYSFNPALGSIEFANLSFDPSSGTLNIASVQDAFGSVSIDIKATDKDDDSNTFSKSFSLAVNPVNDNPTVEIQLSDVEVEVNTASFLVNIEGAFADVEDASLTYDVESGNTALFNVALNENNTAVELSFVPGELGSSTLTLGAEDSGGKRTEQSIEIRVVPPDAPSFSISEEVIEADEDFEDVKTVVITPNTDTPTADYSFSPALTSVEIAEFSFDASSRTLSISSLKDAFGTLNLIITATDQANGENTSVKTLVINIQPVNDDPVVSETLPDITVQKGTESRSINISRVFADVDDTNLTYTAESSNTNLVTVGVSGLELNLTFAEDEVGEATIFLVAEDAADISASVQFIVTIQEEVVGNLLPTANAGPDQTVTDVDNDGSAEVILDASASSDVDGMITSFLWTLVDGDVIASEINPSVLLTVGSYEIVLTVEDDQGAFASDTLSVIVESGTGNGNDQDPPSIPVKNIPTSFSVGSNSELTISVDVVDESGIGSSKFGLRGLTNDEEIQLEDIVGNEQTFQVSRPVNELTQIDPLGIEYQFSFSDVNGNNTTFSGYIYWTYENGAFSSTDLNWREIGNRTDEYFINDFNIIAFPFESQAATNVLNALGAPSDTAWRLFRHSAGSENFSEYGKSGFSTGSSLEEGQGYFLIARDVDEISLGGKIAEMVEEEGYLTHEITVESGWNLIGNPFPFPISWQQVESHELNANFNFVQPLQRLVAGANNRDYDDSSPQLNAFEGAFLFWNGEGNNKIYITPSAVLDNNARYDLKENRHGWELPIVLEQGSLISQRAGIGMRQDAVEGLDYFDALRVPRLQEQTELITKYGQYQMNRSVVAEQTNYLWEASLVGGTTGNQVLLRWDADLVRELDRPIYLWDVLHNRLIDMSAQAESSFQMPKEGEIPLKIYYGTKDELFAALEIDQGWTGAPYPNPVSRQFKLPLNITGEAFSSATDVKLTLYDKHGQQVSKHVFDKLDATYHELEIALPESLASGVYHYQIWIGGEVQQIYNGRLIKQ